MRIPRHLRALRMTQPLFATRPEGNTKGHCEERTNSVAGCHTRRARNSTFRTPRDPSCSDKSISNTELVLRSTDKWVEVKPPKSKKSHFSANCHAPKQNQLRLEALSQHLVKKLSYLSAS